MTCAQAGVCTGAGRVGDCSCALHSPSYLLPVPQIAHVQVQLSLACRVTTDGRAALLGTSQSQAALGCHKLRGCRTGRCKAASSLSFLLPYPYTQQANTPNAFVQVRLEIEHVQAGLPEAQ